MATEIIPLALIDSERKVFANRATDAVTLRVSAIAGGAIGAIGIGKLLAGKPEGDDDGPPTYDSTLQSPIALAPVGALTVFQLTLSCGDTIHVVPGSKGTVAIRVDSTS